MGDAKCDRCGATWAAPESLAPEERQEAAASIRRGDLITAIRRLREMTGLGLRDAKAIVHHVTRHPGHCHRCGMALDLPGVATCPQCRSLNYDW
jgi:hypothetical protein